MGVHPEATAFVEGIAHTALVEQIFTPYLVLVDTMVDLHRYKVHDSLKKCSSSLECFLTLYNLLMIAPRSYAQDGASVVAVFFDKGQPKLKAETAGVKRTSSSQSQGVMPYPPYFTIDKETGELWDTSTNTRHDMVDMPRVVATKSLRLQMFELFATLFFPQEKRYPHCTFYFDYSTDSTRSPLCIEGESLGVKVDSEMSNQWFETDHSAPRFTLQYLQTRYRGREGPMRVMVHTIDRDWLVILLEMLRAAHPTGKWNDLYNCKVTGNEKDIKDKPEHCDTLQIYMRDHKHIWYINGLLTQLANRSISVELVMLMFCLCGNDYVDKTKITNKLGGAYICKQLQSMMMTTSLPALLEKLKNYTGTGVTAESTYDWTALRSVIDVLYKSYPRKGAVSLPPSDAMIKDAYSKIVRTFAYWTECHLYDGPQNAHNKSDLTKPYPLRSDFNSQKPMFLEMKDEKRKSSRSKSQSPMKPPQITAVKPLLDPRVVNGLKGSTTMVARAIHDASKDSMYARLTSRDEQSSITMYDEEEAKLFDDDEGDPDAMTTTLN